jgi:hypothetical protein
MNLRKTSSLSLSDLDFVTRRINFSSSFAHNTQEFLGSGLLDLKSVLQILCALTPEDPHLVLVVRSAHSHTVERDAFFAGGNASARSVDAFGFAIIEGDVNFVDVDLLGVESIQLLSVGGLDRFVRL